jgi:hypothetical protein
MGKAWFLLQDICFIQSKILPKKMETTFLQAIFIAIGALVLNYIKVGVYVHW